MAIPPESIEVGKCYLNCTESGPRILRVLALLPDWRVQYDYQNRYGTRGLSKWNAGILDRSAFARIAVREVPCDWTPDTDERVE